MLLCLKNQLQGDGKLFWRYAVAQATGSDNEQLFEELYGVREILPLHYICLYVCMYVTVSFIGMHEFSFSSICMYVL